MSDIQLISELYDLLKKSNKIAYFNTAKTEVIVRCPYCGDSQEASHAHMYIATVPPYQFYCQRCNTKGYFGAKNLNDLSLDNSELGLMLDKSIKKTVKNTTKTGKSVFEFLNKKRDLLTFNENSPRFLRKIDYLEERFGRSIDVNNLTDLKVVFDIIKFFQVNKCKNLLEFYSEYDNRIEFLKRMDKNSIGFLSADTNYMNIRHIKPFAFKANDTPRRYYMENLNKPVEIGNKVYYIGNQLDILSPTLTVKMTEGIFDIASVFMNMNDGIKDPSTIYVAANGKTFNLPIMNLRRMGFLSINLEIYSDGDVSLDKYKHSLNYDFFEKIHIFYNVYNDEKDFGVPLNKIKVKKYRLK